MMGFQYIQILLYIISVSTVIQASLEDSKWTPLCNNTNGELLLSNINTSNQKIKVDSKWKTFVTNFDPDNIKCVSFKNKEDTIEPKIETKGFVNLKLERPNAFNSEYTVTCKHSSGRICDAKIIVLEKSSKLEKECKFNGTMSCDIYRIEEERKYSGYKNLPEITTQKEIVTTQNESSYDISSHGRTTSSNIFDIFGNYHHPITRIAGGDREKSEDTFSKPEGSEGFWNKDIETTTVISVTSPSLKLSEVVKYSIYVNETWISCDELNEDGQKIEVSMTEDSRYIRCNIKPDKSVHTAKPYIIRMEITDTSNRNRASLAAAMPQFGKLPVEYSYFYVNISAFNDVPLIEDPPKEEERPLFGKVQLIVICISISIVLMIIVILLLYTPMKRNIGKAKVSGESYKFYIKSPSRRKPNPKDIEGGAINTSKRKDSLKDVCSSCDECMALCFCDAEDLGPFSNTDPVEFRKTILDRQLSGDPTKMNPDLTLNSQVKVMAYNPKFEIARKNFVVEQMLGGGHFGCVYSGFATGLHSNKSKTEVAIKTVNDPLDGKQRTALFCEMKILSNIDLHLNLINMLGSCTTEFVTTGEVFMLLEFCKKGDMKKFLIQHEHEFIDNTNCGDASEDDLNSRLLLQWAFHIAKGMQYLARMHIMHGDLAARNILIGTDKDENGSPKLVAKVSDFGLSKTFYDNILYKRQSQHYIPWKWMALEYLQNGHLTIMSDVWSYGVVLWEIFSFGKEPYINVNVEDMLPQFKSGYHPPCPDEASKINSWPVTHVYDKLAKMCFIPDPMKRASFSDLVQELETVLSVKEKEEYSQLSKKYDNNPSPNSNDGLQDKITKTSKNPKTFNESYINMTQNLTPKNTQIESQKTPIHVGGNNLLEIISDQQNTPTDYVMISSNQLSPSHRMMQDNCDKIDSVIIGCDNNAMGDNSLNPPNSHIFSSPDNGYITIEAANQT